MTMKDSFDVTREFANKRGMPVCIQTFYRGKAMIARTAYDMSSPLPELAKLRRAFFASGIHEVLD